MRLIEFVENERKDPQENFLRINFQKIVFKQRNFMYDINNQKILN